MSNRQQRAHQTRPTVGRLALEAALISGHLPRLWPFGVVILLVSLGSLRLSSVLGGDGVQPVLTPLVNTLAEGGSRPLLSLLIIGWTAWIAFSSLLGTLAHGVAIGLGDAAQRGETAGARRMIATVVRRWLDLVQIEVLCGLPALAAGAAGLLWWNLRSHDAGSAGVFGLAGLVGLLLLPVAAAALARPLALRSCLLEQQPGVASILRALDLLRRRGRLLLQAWLLVALLTMISVMPGSLLLTSILPTLSAALLAGLWHTADLVNLIVIMAVAALGGLLHSYVAVFWTLIFREMTA